MSRESKYWTPTGMNEQVYVSDGGASRSRMKFAHRFLVEHPDAPNPAQRVRVFASNDLGELTEVHTRLRMRAEKGHDVRVGSIITKGGDDTITMRVEYVRKPEWEGQEQVRKMRGALEAAGYEVVSVEIGPS